MVDLTYKHGVTLTESADNPSLLRITQQGVTFYNGTADQADEATFQINKPTLVTSLSGASVLGPGYLKEALETHFGEGGSWAIVNRVETGSTEAETRANLIGDATAKTGLYSALRCKALLGIQPRVIVTEGDTGVYVEDGVVSITVTNGGNGYTAAP